ncbi:MAG TPA: OsmC family protein [Kofleriaceae bacterium]|jgi:putative redox protein
MTVVDAKMIKAGEYPLEMKLRTHTFSADASVATGGQDTAPGAHDFFDASLATCKAHTALWYAKRKSYPLERVEARVESDNAEERNGIYKLRVHIELIGPLTDEQKADIHRAIAKCPVHKLMTTSEVVIETV